MLREAEDHACSREIPVSLSLLESIAYLEVSASQVEGLAWGTSPHGTGGCTEGQNTRGEKW